MQPLPMATFLIALPRRLATIKICAANVIFTGACEHCLSVIKGTACLSFMNTYVSHWQGLLSGRLWILIFWFKLIKFDRPQLFNIHCSNVLDSVGIITPYKINRISCSQYNIKPLKSPFEGDYWLQLVQQGSNCLDCYNGRVPHSKRVDGLDKRK